MSSIRTQSLGGTRSFSDSKPPSLPAPPPNAALSSPPATTASRSSASSPILRRFESETLKPHLKRILTVKLSSADWERDRERINTWCKEIAEDVKKRMIEIEPKGFKYAVVTQVVENKGQGGRADLACHWDTDSDVVAQELFVNESLICTLLAFAIRVQY